MAELSRVLSPMESVLGLLDQAAPPNYTVVGRLLGPLADDALRRGLDSLQARHPGLRVGIATAGQALRFQPTTGSIPLRKAAPPWEVQAEAEMDRPFDLAAGPFARVVRVDSGPEDCHLLLTMQHCVGDGMSGVLAMRDLLIATRAAAEGRDPALPPLAPHPPVDSQLPPVVRRWTFGLTAAGHLARQAAWQARHGLPRVFSDQPSPVAGRVTRLAGHCFSVEDTGCIGAAARAAGTTVHGILSATLMQAVAQEHGGRTLLRFGTPVDLRRHLPLPVPEALGVHVGDVDSMYFCDPHSDPWPLARQVRANVVRGIADGTGMLVHRYGALLFRLFRAGGKAPAQMAEAFHAAYRGSTALSNLGRLEVPDRHGSLRLVELHFFVAPSAFSDHIATATCFQGRLQWNFCAATPTVSAERADRIRDDAVERLREACRRR